MRRGRRPGPGAAGEPEPDPARQSAENQPERWRSLTAGLDDIIMELTLEELLPDPQQPRQEHSEVKIRELADSIWNVGVLEPLLVRPAQGAGNRDKYWVVAGGRRLHAARLAGRGTVPCIVRDYNNQQSLIVAIIENLQREDLNDLEKADALQRLRTMTASTWDEVAVRVGLSVDYVRRVVGLLKLEPEVKQLVMDDKLPVRTAIALRPLKAEQQVEMAQRAVSEQLTMEQVRAATQALNPSGRLRFRGTDPTTVPYPSPEETQAELAQTERRAGAGNELSPAAMGDRLVPPQSSDTTTPEPPVTASPVVDALREQQRQYEANLRWLENRSWTPSRVTEVQRQALEETYQELIRLQNRMGSIRQAWLAEDEADPVAAKRRKRLSA